MAKDDVKRGIKYEKDKARAHRGKHVGGPGKEDYRRGDITGEVKARETPVTKPELQKLFRRGIDEVESKTGYTDPAIEYKKRYHPGKKLYKKGKRVA